MKAGWLVALLMAAALAGCATGEPANPSLAAPKLVVASRGDGNATVFVHSAFSERAYEWIHLSIDNRTLVNRTDAFSVEEIVPSGFFLDASAESGNEVYTLRARVDVFPADNRASVAVLDAAGKWPQDAESFGLPFQSLLARRDPTA